MDNFSSSYEAGAKLDTVGFISFDTSAPDHLWFDYADVDGNTAQLAGAANSTDAELLLPAGKVVNRAIAEMREQFGLGQTLGCADQRYKVRSALGEPDSLWDFYANQVLPGVLFEPKSSKSQWAVVGTGALTYDIYPGPFTIDDAYKCSPYGNFWFTLPDVSGADLATMLDRLNGGTRTLGPRQHGAFDAARLSDTYSVPDYVGTGTPSDSLTYDVIYCDFDAWAVEQQLQNITGVAKERELYHPGSNTSSVLVDWFGQHPCPGHIFA